MKLIVPEPVPLAPEVIVIHGAGLKAVQEQPAFVVIVRLPWPPAAGKVGSDAGATSNVQPRVCVTVKVCPAAVIVPVRGAPCHGATVKLTKPKPSAYRVTPVIVIQASLLRASQSQFACVLTLKAELPPCAPKLSPGWLSV